MRFLIGIAVAHSSVLATEFGNSWIEAPDTIARVISTHVMLPTRAVLTSVLLNLSGAMSGTTV